MNAVTPTVDGGWRPLWWRPLVTPGASWWWSARLPRDHGIAAATVVLGDVSAAASVGTTSLSVTLEPQQVEGVAEGAEAALWLDLEAGTRVLWMRGSVTRMGDD